MNYSTEEKLAHLDKARTYVKNGKGTYTSYAREHGVARTTLHQWLRAFGVTKGTQKGKSLVKLGKPNIAINKEQSIRVNYYGSKIVVSSQNDLVALLKGIKIAESI